MAIIVEEEKTSTGIISFLGWASIAAIFLAAAYYVFFTAPPTVVITPPANLQTFVSISGANLNPQDILQDKSFQTLKQYVPPPVPTGPGLVGRANPFVSF